MLVLNPYLRAIKCGRDEALIKHGTHSLYSHSIVDQQKTGLLGLLLSHFATPASVDELVARGIVATTLEAQARELADYLQERGVLVDPTRSATALYVDTILCRGDSAADGSRFARTRVRLLGMGALAERLEWHLAGLGLGDLEPAPNGWDVECESADFLVLASDSFAPGVFHEINERAVDYRRPWLLVHIDGSEVVVGPTFVPGETPCYYEFEIQAEASLGLRDGYQLYKEHMLSSPSPAPVPPAYVDIAAGFTAVAVMRQLAGAVGLTAGRAVRIEFESLRVDYVEVAKLPRCPACAPAHAGPRHLYL